MACALSISALTVAAATPAHAASCALDSVSFKDSGQNGGAGGYFLTDEGHNNIVKTTGTGNCWQFILASNNNYFLISDGSLCLNVGINLYVYADGCNAGDPFEWWFDTPGANGSNIYQNSARGLNLTAATLSNGSPVEVAGGPANSRNLWLVTNLHIARAQHAPD
jgi:hypothetical protein